MSLRHILGINVPRIAKVSHLQLGHLILRRQQDVPWLEVPVNNPLNSHELQRTRCPKASNTSKHKQAPTPFKRRRRRRRRREGDEGGVTQEVCEVVETTDQSVVRKTWPSPLTTSSFSSGSDQNRHPGRIPLPKRSCPWFSAEKKRIRACNRKWKKKVCPLRFPPAG